MIKKIAIIGGGEIGKAISYIIQNPGIDVSLWDKDPTKATTLTPEECFAGAHAIFFCIPSWAVRFALIELSSKLPSDIPLVFVSKGLEMETNLTAPEIASEFVSKERIVFMGGPMIAEEVMAGKGGHAVLGGEQATAIAEMFKPPSVIPATRLAEGEPRREAGIQKNNISAETYPDAFSIAILGVLKNIYALLMGASEGAGFGNNIRAYLFSKSLEEMDAIARALRGKANVMNMAGVGDLFTTSMSSNSSNRKAGFNFASGNTPTRKSEGMASVASIFSRLGEKATEMPLLSFVLKMVESKSVNKEDWHKILSL